ncbi:MAG: cardiolipin synthase [Muribaculaceae bacterium]|nr:cardiolipin synthase [bacterium]MCM1494048.1 cardiolipin synthase [Muribaculaceae bacterium]
MANEETDSRGMRLLKKGQKGLVHALFSRFGLILLLFLLQVAVLFSMFMWFRDLQIYISGITVLFTVVMVLYLLNSRLDPTAKITWLVIIMLMPVFGAFLLWYTKSEVGHRLIKKRVNQISDQAKDCMGQDPQVAGALEREAPDVAALARYVSRSGCFPVFDRTAVTYFPIGEKKWEEMLRQLEQARQYIFLEYFIVDEGLMWGKVLEILAKKAAEGVDVRVMYDGTCEFTTLSHNYPERLRKLGIQCKMFAPLTPFVSTYYNYRDHRKILVIDGHTAFTGGVNLADEYINRKVKHGHWKDTAVMLKGPAAGSFAMMFLEMWNIDGKSETDYKKYLSVPALPAENAPGYVMPYGDCPLDDDKVGERVYMDILNRARKYVHIMTPYLILDGEMETALKFAAERGVDVKLILPGIPDKEAAYALAKTHYRSLLDSGVKIYEYSPGFVHAKLFVSDDREGVVGTINLDYRSLYHHFECAAYLYGVPCLAAMEEDYQDTLKKCRTVTYETLKAERRGRKLLGCLMKAVAPLM